MTGLNDQEIKERLESGQYNFDTTIETKSVKQIFITNMCTLFNLINIIFAILIIIVGAYKNLLFLGTIICNTFIGIISELRSKKIIDKLSLISEKKAKVIRNGKEQEIKTTEIVLDDIIIYEIGNQIPTDTKIIDGILEVNESLITGEINPIKKQVGDTLLSGSFVVGGHAVGKVIHVGTDNYTYKITKDAKYLKPINSEIMKSMKQIIKIISYIIVPLGIIFYLKQLYLINNTTSNAVINTVAALIAVIPDGLMLLTSTVMAISVIKLSKYKVLVQDLYCIENLARVDTICFDKTGTLTKGTMHVEDLIKLKNFDDNIIKEINFNLDNHNPTMNALVKKYGKQNDLKVTKIIPFSSEKKWSGVQFENNKTYVIGAPEFVVKDKTLMEEINKYTNEYRVIVLVSTTHPFIDDNLPNKLEPIGLFLIEDEIRKEATNLIKFLEENDVNVKIISGDNPKTVSLVASKLGLKFKDNYIDTTGLSDEELSCIAEQYSIFGRVTPQGKKVLIKSLQAKKHIVAMTGDGVNDVLSLRQADCAIALSNGSDAARNVSELVLLNSNFNSIPKIIKEGRRTINNISRSASLFITKTLYALFLLALFLFVKTAYPFIPIQLTLTSTFTIGIPAFILALEPNHERVKGKFLSNVIKVALPTSLTIVFDIILILGCSYIINISSKDISTLGVLLIATTGFMHIYKISKPLNLIRTTLLISMITSFLIAVFGFENLFSLSIINNGLLALYLTLFLFSYLFFCLITKTFEILIWKGRNV